MIDFTSYGKNRLKKKKKNSTYGGGGSVTLRCSASPRTQGATNPCYATACATRGTAASWKAGNRSRIGQTGGDDRSDDILCRTRKGGEGGEQCEHWFLELRWLVLGVAGCTVLACIFPKRINVKYTAFNLRSDNTIGDLSRSSSSTNTQARASSPREMNNLILRGFRNTLGHWRYT